MAIINRLPADHAYGLIHAASQLFFRIQQGALHQGIAQHHNRIHIRHIGSGKAGSID